MTDERAQLIRERVHLAFRMAQIDIELDRLPAEIIEDVERVNEASETSREIGDG